MSYSIEEALRDWGIEAAGLRKLRDLFPNAEMISLPDTRMVWCSAQATPTEVLVAVSEKNNVYLIPCMKVAGISVVLPSSAWKDATVMFSELANRHPDTMQTIFEHWV